MSVPLGTKLTRKAQSGSHTANAVSGVVRSYMLPVVYEERYEPIFPRTAVP